MRRAGARGFARAIVGTVAVVCGLACTLSGNAGAQRAWKTPGEADATTARRFASEGRCDEALALFDNAVEARSGDASLRRDRGLCHERLAHPAPAIEDYRAYLSMEPTAPDAGPIRARLDALEQNEVETTGTPGPTDKAGAPSADAERDAAEAKSRRAQGLPRSGDFFLGLHIGDRGWSERGYAKATVAYGLAGGYSYATPLELEARLVLLRTNILQTSGYGAAVDNTFKLGIDSQRRFELGLSLGLGLESQSSEVGVNRKYFFGHVSPKVRLLISGPIALEGAPELGMGLIDGVTLAGESTMQPAFFYGGYVRLVWIIRKDKTD